MADYWREYRDAHHPGEGGRTIRNRDRRGSSCEEYNGPIPGECCKCGWPEEDHPSPEGESER